MKRIMEDIQKNSYDGSKVNNSRVEEEWKAIKVVYRSKNCKKKKP